MPADTKAISYEWYMTMDAEEQIVRLLWRPLNGVIESSMTLGEISVEIKNEETGEWAPANNWGGPLPFAAAQGYARREGFHIEAPIYK